MTLREYLTGIANAIRTAEGSTGSIPAASFADRIAALRAALRLQSKTVSPATTAQTVTPDAGYDGLEQVTVGAMPTAVQATPTISVSNGGLITASAAQGAGYVSAGTKSATRQLTTRAGTVITPGTAQQTAVNGQVFTTGPVYVAGDSNLSPGNIKSGVSIFGVEGSYSGGGGAALTVVNFNRSQVTLTSTYSGTVIQLLADESTIPLFSKIWGFSGRIVIPEGELLFGLSGPAGGTVSESGRVVSTYAENEANALTVDVQAGRLDITENGYAISNLLSEYDALDPADWDSESFFSIIIEKP